MNAHTITLDECIEQMQDLLNCQFDVGITVADNPQVIVLRLSKTANVSGLPENLFLELTVYEDCLSTQLNSCLRYLKQNRLPDAVQKLATEMFPNEVHPETCNIHLTPGTKRSICEDRLRVRVIELADQMKASVKNASQRELAAISEQLLWATQSLNRIRSMQNDRTLITAFVKQLDDAYQNGPSKICINQKTTDETGIGLTLEYPNATRVNLQLVIKNNHLCCCLGKAKIQAKQPEKKRYAQAMEIVSKDLFRGSMYPMSCSARLEPGKLLPDLIDAEKQHVNWLLEQLEDVILTDPCESRDIRIRLDRTCNSLDNLYEM